MRPALLLLLLTATGCAQLGKLGSVFKAGLSFRLPDIGDAVRDKLPSPPERQKPEELEFAFRSAWYSRLIVQVPTEGWKYDPVVRDVNEGDITYHVVFRHQKTGARISMEASTKGGGDAFIMLDNIANILRIMRIPTTRVAKTTYQSVDDWSIHRAEYGCVIPPIIDAAAANWLAALGCADISSAASLRRKTILLSFHDPRLTAAAASMQVLLHAEWPEGGAKNVNKALYTLTALTRIRPAL
ncbi:hypothetical protein HY633_01570 [Candidatus Uhrbacteria bacterium]|nr:hypothetical protein [Candidatus Uhrbacteria bacterium]